MSSLSQRARAAIAAVLVILTGAGVTIALSVGDDPGNPGHPKGSVTVTIGGGPSGAPTSKITLSPQAQAIASQQAREDAAGKTAASESDLHETTPPSAAELKAAAKRAPPGQGPIPAHVPQATQSEPGCTTAIVRNQSARPAGARVLLGVVHWTGSLPTLGSSAGGLAIVRWFDDLRAQASSNEVTDQDGRCWLTVPETAKAWTQANANPWSVSVEITNAGVQPLFSRPAGRAVVVRLLRAWHKRWGIPYRHGAVNASCVPTRSGFLAHRDLGACGGGHPDVGSFDLDGLIREAGSSSSPTSSDRRFLTKGERAGVSCLEGQRKIARRHHGWAHVAPSHLRRASSCKRDLKARRAELERLGLGKPHRRERARELGRVIAG